MDSEDEFEHGNNQISDNSNQGNQNINKFKMGLLFIQTKELNHKYENKMEFSPEQYRLVNKEWLDNFKNRYNYNEAIQNFNSFNDYSNYFDVKSRISQQLNVDENCITNEDQNIMNNCQIKKEKYQSKFEYPVDIELVKEQFFQDCKLGNIGFPMCNVYLGNKEIFVIDDQRDSIAYHCSLVENNDNSSNFLIQVNSTLMFPKSQILSEQFEKIISEGFNNYLSKRNININLNEEQKIIDPMKHNPIGIFINLIKGNNNNNYQGFGAPNSFDNNQNLSNNIISLNNNQNNPIYSNNNQMPSPMSQQGMQNNQINNPMMNNNQNQNYQNFNNNMIQGNSGQNNNNQNQLGINIFSEINSGNVNQKNMNNLNINQNNINQNNINNPNINQNNINQNNINNPNVAQNNINQNNMIQGNFGQNNNNQNQLGINIFSEINSGNVNKNKMNNQNAKMQTKIILIKIILIILMLTKIILIKIILIILI